MEDLGLFLSRKGFQQSFEAVLCIGDTQIDTAWSTVSMGGKFTFTWTAWDMPPWCDGKRNVAGMADTV